jgi:hypothetical protein
MVVTSPFPTHLWGPAALLLAAIAGTAIMNRVRARAEVRLRHERQAVDGPPGSPWPGVGYGGVGTGCALSAPRTLSSTFWPCWSTRRVNSCWA